MTKTVTGGLNVEMSTFIGLIILFKMQIFFAEIQILFDVKILFLGKKVYMSFHFRKFLHYTYTHEFNCSPLLEEPVLSSHSREDQKKCFQYQ